MNIIVLVPSLSGTLEDKLERQRWPQGDSGDAAVVHRESDDDSLNQHNSDRARLEKCFKYGIDRNGNQKGVRSEKEIGGEHIPGQALW